MAGFGVETTITSYSREEIRRARQQVGPTASSEAFGEQIRKNRQAALEQTTSRQQAIQKEQSNKEQSKYAKAKLQNAAKTIESDRESSTRKDWHLKLLESVDNAADSAGDAFTNLDKSATNFLKQTTKTCSIFQEAIQETTQSVAGSITGLTVGLQQFEQEALHDIQGWQAGLKKALEPIGLCSAIGDLTDLAKNPLGAPQYLVNSLTSLVGKISPKFVEQADAAYKTLNLEGLSNLPSKMMGSIRSLATAADAILSVPFEIMSDVYNGLMEILDAIADLIDTLVTTIMNLAMSAVKALVDAIIPVDMLLEFFAAVGDLASFVGDLAGLVGGFSAVTDITNQVSGFASLASGALNNPLGAALEFIPGAGDIVGQGLGVVSQVTGALRNPEQFLPSGIREQMQNISSIPGLGFVGNLGYSVGDTLDSLSEGVFSKALEQFSDKLPILNDAFNKPQEEPPAIDPQESYSDEYQPQKVQGPVQHSTAQGIPHASDTSPIFPQASISKGKQQTVTAYGITEHSDGTVTGPWGATPYGIPQSLIDQENAAFSLTPSNQTVSNNFNRL